eukprot:2798290-Amphidinium_carterae.1
MSVRNEKGTQGNAKQEISIKSMKTENRPCRRGKAPKVRLHFDDGRLTHACSFHSFFFPESGVYFDRQPDACVQMTRHLKDCSRNCTGVNSKTILPVMIFSERYGSQSSAKKDTGSSARYSNKAIQQTNASK